ncbi:MAG: hypothetical protein Q3M24_08145 [Candidatus Electrothrix aestuarii]|uniref:DUF2946 domain-containing protein n=1 Tax=Candidatus Electrothrix aestuarii TaxID=3062594 RepID=A0AAU8M0E0_9BACT|nr:hypothetical protein [Candidatus Electrothrix aestuarii]
MLRIRSAQKYIAVLPLLIVFYLAVGIHALHPFVHRHLHSATPEHSSTHYDQHHHTHDASGQKTVGLFAKTELKHHCPLCEFLACNWLLVSSSKKLTFSIPSFQQVFLSYQAVLGSAQLSSYPIRGPPVLFS